MEQSHFSIEPFFLNKKLAYSILPGHLQQTLRQEIFSYEMSGSVSAVIFMNEAYKEHIEAFLIQKSLSSIEEQIAKKELKEGQLVWTKRTFQFKGSIQALRNFENKGVASYGTFYSIDTTSDKRKIVGKYNVENFTSSSSTGILSGRVNHFILGYVEQLKKDEIQLRPIIVGKCLYNIGSVPWPSQNILECTAEDISEFSNIKKISRRSIDPFLSLNKDISELQIKKWIGELIGTSDIPKDWAGEKSDLLLPVQLKGQRMMAAFLLKGPSKFHELRIKDLGATGDQLLRLFEEPASLCILVHCHKVSSAVRKNMEIFSTQISRPRHFCIIDGYDLIRLWKAYGKLPKKSFSK